MVLVHLEMNDDGRHIMERAAFLVIAIEILQFGSLTLQKLLLFVCES